MEWVGIICSFDSGGFFGIWLVVGVNRGATDRLVGDSLWKSSNISRSPAGSVWSGG